MSNVQPAAAGAKGSGLALLIHWAKYKYVWSKAKP